MIIKHGMFHAVWAAAFFDPLCVPVGAWLNLSYCGVQGPCANPTNEAARAGMHDKNGARKKRDFGTCLESHNKSRPQLAAAWQARGIRAHSQRGTGGLVKS